MHDLRPLSLGCFLLGLTWVLIDPPPPTPLASRALLQRASPRSGGFLVTGDGVALRSTGQRARDVAQGHTVGRHASTRARTRSYHRQGLTGGR